MLDITEYYGATSGGIRTYLDAKAAWVAAHAESRQVLVVPAGQEAIVEGEGYRRYEIQGPAIPGNAPYHFLLSVPAVRRILQHERPDLIEVGSHLVVPWVTRVARRGLGIPLVWFYHGHLPQLVFPDRARGPVQGVAQGAAWSYVRWLARGCRAVIVASPHLERELAAHGVHNTAVVPLGVDLEHFHPRRRAARPETRARVGLPEGPLVLFAGRLAREKQLNVVLDGWATVEHRTGARLVILGDGPRKGELRRHPYASRVIWLPFERDRERLADLLAAVDVYLAPGPYETFGLSALEAMASGTPLLSVDRGGVAERVEASGAGELYSFDDPGDLSTAALALLRSDLAALGTDARRHAERYHGWEATFDALFSTYRRLLGREA